MRVETPKERRTQRTKHQICTQNNNSRRNGFHFTSGRVQNIPDHRRYHLCRKLGACWGSFSTWTRLASEYRELREELLVIDKREERLCFLWCFSCFFSVVNFFVACFSQKQCMVTVSKPVPAHSGSGWPAPHAW